MSCFILYPRAKLPCHSRYLLTSSFCTPTPYDEKRISFLVLVLGSFVGLHRTNQLQLLCISGWGTDLDYCDVEWFALDMNWDHSAVFEMVPKYCISASFVDCEGYSISSKGFLSTVVDIMVVWIKLVDPLHGSQPCHGEGACITQWSYEPCHAGPLKMDGS